MRIFQFGFGSEPDSADHLQHNYSRLCAAYTGNHDNNTAVGWFREQLPAQRRRVLAYTGGSVAAPQLGMAPDPGQAHRLARRRGIGRGVGAEQGVEVGLEACAPGDGEDDPARCDVFADARAVGHRDLVRTDLHREGHGLVPGPVEARPVRVLKERKPAPAGRDPANRPAWQRFFRRYEPFIYGYCRGGGLPPDAATEVTQRVLIRLSHKMSQFAYDPSKSFRGWLRKMIVFEVRNFRRELFRDCCSRPRMV